MRAHSSFPLRHRAAFSRCSTYLLADGSRETGTSRCRLSPLHLYCSRCLQSSMAPQSQQHRMQSTVSKFFSAVREGLKPSSPPSSSHSPAVPSVKTPSVDPLRLVAEELQFLKKNMRQLLGSGHPLLSRIANYYSNTDGKQIRPLLVLLMSQATALTTERNRIDAEHLATSTSNSDQSYINHAISSPAVLADANPDASPLTASLRDMDLKLDADEKILPSQRRLAEIVELIHTASLLHDDVIDNAVTRRAVRSINLEFGNKMSVLAGDFLLGRASVALTRLRHFEVTELIATTIANLVEGEFMQLKNTALDEKSPVFTDDTITYYLQKTYLKSASLISKSCRAAALLGDCDPQVVDAAYLYGKNLGLAFQLVDDLLDYTITSGELGKPAGADLELGLATAPLLFAWKEYPELGPMVGRKFSHERDVQTARRIVLESNGLDKTRALAEEYSRKAIHAIQNFPESPAKQSLCEICTKATSRRK